jgi:hypothetical protein
MSDSDSELTEDMRFVWSSLTKSMPYFVKKHAPLMDGDSCGQGVFLQNVPVRRGSEEALKPLTPDICYATTPCDPQSSGAKTENSCFGARQ